MPCVPSFPLFGSNLQHPQDCTGFRSLSWFLVPTRHRHFPKFLVVAPGDDEVRFFGSHPITDEEHYCHLLLLVKWELVRQNLGLLQHSAEFAPKGAHLVDGHPHRIYVRPLGRTAPREIEPVRIQELRGRPTYSTATINGGGVGHSGGGARIASDPHESNVC